MKQRVTLLTEIKSCDKTCKQCAVLLLAVIDESSCAQLACQESVAVAIILLPAPRRRTYFCDLWCKKHSPKGKEIASFINTVLSLNKCGANSHVSIIFLYQRGAWTQHQARRHQTAPVEWYTFFAKTNTAASSLTHAGTSIRLHSLNQTVNWTIVTSQF